MTSLRESALQYQAMGCHIFPCLPQSKEPMVLSWKNFQAAAPSREQVERWWTDEPNANIAMVTGRGLLVIDLDGPGAQELLSKRGIALPLHAPRVRTGGGQHVYLHLPAGVVSIGNRAAVVSARDAKGQPCKPQVDVRSDGGYVIAPPSIHPNGAPYAWIVPFTVPPDAPNSLLALLRTRPDAPSPGTPGWIATALQGVEEGQRDQTCARLAGYFLSKQVPPDVVLALLMQFAGRCRPSLPERDVLRVVRSIARREPTGVDEEEQPVDSPMVQHVSTALDRLVIEANRGIEGFVKTPFPDLNDRLVGGFAPGDLVYVGARPGVGKTLLGLDIARYAALHGKTTLIVSREMLAFSLARRLVAQEGRTSASQLRRGFFDAAASAAMERLRKMPIYITDTASTLPAISAAFASVAGHVDLLIVDYLQLVRTPQAKDRRLGVEAVSAGLKAIALREQIPVVCISSLARPQDGSDRAPVMRDLKESSNLEHDADVVLLLHRPKMEMDTQCVVAKARDGMLGTVNLVFRPTWVSFQEMETELTGEMERDTTGGWT